MKLLAPLWQRFKVQRCEHGYRLGSNGLGVLRITTEGRIESCPNCVLYKWAVYYLEYVTERGENATPQERMHCNVLGSLLQGGEA